LVICECNASVRKLVYATPLRMPSSGMLGRVALVRTDVSEERSASIIRVTRISELIVIVFLRSVRRYNPLAD
jgi:hypothetical protein